MRIAVAGTGYVGLSMACLLAQHNSVVAVDVVAERVEKVNRRESPVQDEYIERFFREKELDLVATLDAAAAYREAELVIVAAPTNYDPQRNFFDTSAVEEVVGKPTMIREGYKLSYSAMLSLRNSGEKRMFPHPNFSRSAEVYPTGTVLLITTTA